MLIIYSYLSKSTKYINQLYFLGFPSVFYSSHLQFFFLNGSLNIFLSDILGCFSTILPVPEMNNQPLLTRCLANITSGGSSKLSYSSVYPVFSVIQCCINDLYCGPYLSAYPSLYVLDYLMW